MTAVHTQVCIAGGGPAGLLLGLLLAKRGVDVLVLEGHETFEREFRGEVLQPSTVQLLDRLGLLNYVLAQPHSRLEAGKVRLGGRDVGEVSFARVAPEYPYAIWMPQPVLLAALRRKAETLPSFACWMGARVSSLDRRDGTVRVGGLRHGKEPFEVQADVIVGADGRHSTIARLGGFDVEYEHHDFDVIWFTIPQPPGWSSTFYFSLGEAMRGLLLPRYPQQVQVGLVLAPGEWRAWRRDGVTAVADRVRRFDPIVAAFADELRDFTPFVPLPGVLHFVRDWAQDGVLLIGDAAHTMSPVAAIGVNVAMATAAVAAQTLYPHVGGGIIGRDVLAEVQRVREADVRRIHGFQRQAHRALRVWGRQGAATKWIVRHTLPLFLRSPLVPRLQRRLFFGTTPPTLDPAFRFE